VESHTLFPYLFRSDEFHFLMNCDKLIHERVTLFRNISDIVP
jgi:hypothetical protein